MTIPQLDQAIKATPFQPFSLRITDGRAFHVPHPDFISHPPRGRTALIFVYSEKNEAFSILDVGLITELDFSKPKLASRRSTKKLS